MIELDNLRTASLYINNQLLSRGLLHDGQSIDFTRPGNSDGEIGATMGRIMSVVNDLILRRDRDAEHRETLSTTLRTVRAESLRQANDIQRLQEKNVEAQRKVGISESSEVAMRTQLKTAEVIIHRLKEEAARTKVLVGQTRAACANEVRKRDRQIDGLKKAVSEASRARGASKSPGITTIVVTGEVGSDCDQMVANGATTSDGYDLRMEANSFLAELAKGLSEENETLMGLIRKFTEQLKEMSGWDGAGTGASPVQDAKGHALPLPANCVELSAEIESLLEHLRTILTNPSFVPIEEVVVREDEIHRLRDGWEKMETRWKEAVHLIDGWRRRMQVNGRPVNMEELKMSLRLSPVRVQNVEETSQGVGFRLSAVPEDAEEVSMTHSPSPAERLRYVAPPELDDPDVSDCDSSIFEDDADVDDFDEEGPNVEILEQSLMLQSPPLPPPPQLSPLRDSNTAGNRGGVGQLNQRKRPAPIDFTTVAEENTWDLKSEAPLPPPHLEKPQHSPRKRVAQPLPPVQQEDTALPSFADLSASASSASSVQLIQTPDDSAPKTTTTSSARTRGRRSPTPRFQDRKVAVPSSARRPAPAAGPTRPNSTRTTRPKPDDNEPPTAKPTRSASGASTTSTVGNSSALSNKSTDVMPPPPLPSVQPTPSRDRSPRRGNSRLPLPRTGGSLLPPPQQSPLSMATIAAKLAASEREADAARVRAKLKALRGGSKKRVSLAAATADTEAADAAAAARSTRSDGGVEGAVMEMGDDDVDELAPRPEERSLPPRKRERRTSRVASRRRSTLNPWELGALIQGSVGAEGERE
ncbi:Afadin and alpha-actinin-binding-domain-containing protein [Lasiosphaeris hirsuta]|uniref:Afadin and alpha-actinin-binding-domain-containing protein n=1 Tax=Lasiosphaeris hirsuta TaxID=260670 RepID=A0AA40E0N7_9PEZI|nr:Afadin and alpha-actinin-binding-domain-containing protein [Lasiosphaeris hirsuta]